MQQILLFKIDDFLPAVAERSNGPNDYPFGMYDEDGRVSMRTKYLYSVYFAITTVTTIGFGGATFVF